MAESNRNATNGEPARQEGEPAESLETARPKGEPAALLKPARHEHPLCLYNTLQVYTCSGCKERGNRVGYKCNDMDSVGCDNFSLHKDCAELPDIYRYQFRTACHLKFRPRTRGKRLCNACHKLLRGYVFESEKRDIRFHPQCMTLPRTLHFTAHPDHQLKLLASDKGKPFTCFSCDTTFKSGGWRYRCPEAACKVSVDVSCAKTNIYGLPESDPVKSTCGFIGSNAIKWSCQNILTGFVQGLSNFLMDKVVAR